LENIFSNLFVEFSVAKIGHSLCRIDITYIHINMYIMYKCAIHVICAYICIDVGTALICD